MTTDETRMAREEAADRLVAAGLDELWAAEGSKAAAPDGVVGRRGSGTRAWAGVAAAAVVAAVVVSFGWGEFARGRRDASEGGRPGAAAAVETKVGVEEPRIVTDPAQVDALPVDASAVELSGELLDDAALAALVARCPELSRLVLRDVAVTDDGLAALERLPGLVDLGLPSCARITDRGLERIRGLEGLEALDLAGWVGQTASFGEEPAEDYVDPYAKYTDGALAELGRMPRLARLGLSGTEISDAGLRTLVGGGAPLRALDLSTTSISTAGLAQLQALAGLEELDFSGANRFVDADAEAIGALPHLRVARLGRAGMGVSDLTDAGLRRLVAGGRFEDLELVGCVKLTSSAMETLAGLPRLRRLVLNQCGGLDEAGLTALAGAPVLEELSLYPGRNCAPVALGGGDRGVEVGAGLRRLVTGSARLRALVLPELPSGDLGEAFRELLRHRPTSLVLRDHSGRALASTGLELEASTPTEYAVAALVDPVTGEILELLQRRRAGGGQFEGPDGQVVQDKRRVAFACAALSPGSYELRVFADGCIPEVRTVDITRDEILRLEIEPRRFRGQRMDVVNGRMPSMRAVVRGAGQDHWGDVAAIAIAETPDGTPVSCHALGGWLTDCEARDRGFGLNPLPIPGGPVRVVCLRRGHPVREQLTTVRMGEEREVVFD
ncbi:MAG: hypothetical protein R3F20_07880 [Planctomycetota bacterium]